MFKQKLKKKAIHPSSGQTADRVSRERLGRGRSVNGDWEVQGT